MKTVSYKASEVCNYNFTPQHKLFLDANIWLYLYAPHKPGNQSVQTYSNVFGCILNAQSQIYIDVLVVSEFINAYARIKWALVTQRKQEFKKFRNSSRFKSVAKDITDDVKEIMKHCLQVESGFETLKIDDLLNEYTKGNSDFNDQVITELCKSNGFMLITDDGDFKTQEIQILTANKSLLTN